METPDTYRSLAKTSEGLYKEKGSKFISFAYPVENEQHVKELLDQLKKEYHDARHYCYAFVFKLEEGREETFRASDDGEPAHSAGDPILGQIRSYSLQDVLIVVVRYFGGTKLGMSGLINAYKMAAMDAICNNVIVEKVIKQIFRISFPYTATSEVMQLVHQHQVEIVSQSFEQGCLFELAIRKNKWQEAQKYFINFLM